MGEKDTDRDEGKPRQGYIPHPPSKADIDRVSGQQGMITDEWTGPQATPRPAEPNPAKAPGDEAEGHPS